MTLNPIPVLLSLMHPIAVTPPDGTDEFNVRYCDCGHVARARRWVAILDHAASHEIYAGHVFTFLLAPPAKELT